MSITPAVPVESPAPAGIESRSKWAVAQWHLAAGAVLFLLIVAGYGNSFRSEWVLDNRYIIEQDPRTKAIQWDDAGNTPGVRSVFTQDYWWPKGISGLYRPITSFTYWLNWTAFGNGHHDNARQQVVGFHWVNLGIHSLNAILFYALMLRLTKRYWVSFFAAAIFALHPVATESVTNIIGRADMLAGTTVIGGMLLCFAIAQSSGWKKVGYLISLMLLAALGFFSKESSGALVFVVILYDVVYRLSDRIHEIDWREVCLAISRAVTIAGLMFFTVCVYLLVLVPWMGEMRDVSNVLPTSPSVINPPAGHVGFDSTSALDARAISITDPLANHKSLHDELERRIDANSNFSGRIKIGKASDGSQWALFDAQGKIVKGGTSSLSLHYVGGHGLPSLSEPVDVCLVDSRFPLAITGTIIGLCLMFATTALLALRRFSIVVVTTVVASSMLIAMSASYTPMSDTQPPGAGQVLIRKNLVPNPTTPQMRDAARDAQEQHRPNPVLLAFRNVSTWGLAIFAVAFLVSEASFRFLWAERKEDDPARSKWVGFFDVYYVLLSVTVLLFVVRDWIFANATPAEQPFLDNPLHNLSFIASRLTAAKVFVLLLWKLIWPIHLSPEYSYNQIPLFGFHGVTFWQNLSCIIALFVIVAIAGMAIWCWRRGHKAVCFFIFLYYINAFPTSNFPYIIGSIMAERFLYLPLIGFAAVVVIGIDATSKRIWGSLDESMPIVRGAASPNFSAFRVVPHIILAILVVLYGLRAYARNKDWFSDATLWASALKESPRSFRSYQSYAFALFEEDPAGNCKPPKESGRPGMIGIDEAGLQIVDSLPNPLNSTRLYLHLGMYYQIEAQIVGGLDAQGQPVLNEASRVWWEKSARILERAIPIDRAFNEINRKREEERGKSTDEIVDVGLPPMYAYLSQAYMRLGNWPQAMATLAYAKHMEPLNADWYFRIAQVQLAQNQYEPAAVSLVQTLRLDGSRREAWQLLSNLLRALNTESYPCIGVNAQGMPQLDPSRLLVHSLLFQSSVDFVKTLLLAHETANAEAIRDTAVNNYGFDRKKFFDPLFDPEIMKQFSAPVPANPIYYEPEPVTFDWMIPEVQAAFESAGHGAKFDKLDVEIVEGRAVYRAEVPVDGHTHRIRVSDEGLVISDTEIK